MLKRLWPCVALLLVACGGGRGVPGGDAVARVNKDEISGQQLAGVLQRQGSGASEAAARQVLERLIDQTLAAQKATELRLDRDPLVAQQIEAARREVIARAWVDRVGDGVAKPSAEEIAKFYVDKPALFKERRVYSLQELQIEVPPERQAELRERLAAARDVNEFAAGLKSAGVRFATSQVVRAPEQLPPASLDAIVAMKDGGVIVNAVPGGLAVLSMAGSRAEPIDEAHARPLIEAMLLNQRRTEAVQDALKALRDDSRIDYFGKFAPAAATSAPAR